MAQQMIDDENVSRLNNKKKISDPLLGDRKTVNISGSRIDEPSSYSNQFYIHFVSTTKIERETHKY